MKKFDIELAKAGHPIQTRDGKPARIICYDRVSSSNNPIVALVSNRGEERTYYYTEEGVFAGDWSRESNLFMVPTEREGWVNVYPMSSQTANKDFTAQCSNVYKTEPEALRARNNHCIATIKITWEE